MFTLKDVSRKRLGTRLKNCTFSTTGKNPYFILEPGYQLVFEGEGDNGPVNVTRTVLNQTKVVGDGIVARVVEEKTVNAETGDLIELRPMITFLYATKQIPCLPWRRC